EGPWPKFLPTLVPSNELVPYKEISCRLSGVIQALIAKLVGAQESLDLLRRRSRPQIGLRHLSAAKPRRHGWSQRSPDGHPDQLLAFGVATAQSCATSAGLVPCEAKAEFLHNDADQNLEQLAFAGTFAANDANSFTLLNLLKLF